MQTARSITGFLITAALQQHSSASEQDAPVTIVLERFADWANDAEYAIESLYKAAIAAGAPSSRSCSIPPIVSNAFFIDSGVGSSMLESSSLDAFL